MSFPTSPLALSVLLPHLVAGAMAQGVEPVPAPVTPDSEVAGSPAEEAAEGEAVHGVRVDPTAFGKSWTQTMDEAIERAANAEEIAAHVLGRNGSQGVWELPSPKYKLYSHSGRKAIINRWGDPSMGIGFGEAVDVMDVWIASQGGRGIWAEAVRVVGYLGDEVVGTTEWFEDIDPEPSLMPIGLSGVDRIVIEARPSSSGAGFYALDDLRLTSGADERVIDFEDAPWDSCLLYTSPSPRDRQKSRMPSSA